MGLPLLHVALRIAYDGTAFESYARMPGRRTVEDALIAALKEEGLVDAGFRTGSRTDAGVSALENVCKVVLERKHLKGLVPSLQKRVPDGLWITGAALVDEAWRPRHAIRRQYGYTAVPRKEDLSLMRDACAAFVGRNNMTAFAKMEEGRKPERNVFRFTADDRDGMWEFHVEGDGFLWNQVRRMVAAVMAVGRGEATVDDIRASLQTGVPHRVFRVAPAEGLLLEKVQYEGLAWEQEAGRLGPQLVPKVLQSAAVRRMLAAHLLKLAPWPRASETGSTQQATAHSSGDDARLARQGAETRDPADDA